MDVAFILRKRRLEPKILEVKLEGELREGHPKYFKNIQLIYRAKGPGITIEELERAASLSFKSYCAILGMLQKAVEITYRCEIIN